MSLYREDIYARKNRSRTFLRVFSNFQIISRRIDLSKVARQNGLLVYYISVNQTILMKLYKTLDLIMGEDILKAFTPI